MTEENHIEMNGSVGITEEVSTPQPTPSPPDGSAPPHSLPPDHPHHGIVDRIEEEIKSGVSSIAEQIAVNVEEEKERIEEEIKTAKRLGMRGMFLAYCRKFKGQHGKRPPRVILTEVIWSWIAAFVGIGAVSAFHFHFLTHEHLVGVVGSFGASAVLIYGSYTSPLAQPRNFVGGHFVSAIIGVTVRFAVYDQSVAIAAAFAVASAIAAMQLTNTTHPPGGATALIAVTSPEMAWGGYLYVFMPILSGCAIMLAAALVMNNLFPSRTYPVFWW